MLNVDGPMKFSFTNGLFGDMARARYELDRDNFLRYAYPGDAGFDIYCFVNESSGHTSLLPNHKIYVNTGITLEIPVGYFGRLVGRSSTERKKDMRVIEGIVDCGYRGEMLIGLSNTSGSRIDVTDGVHAQILIHRVNQFPIVYSEKLSNSDRGEKGFGSSGK